MNTINGNSSTTYETTDSLPAIHMARYTEVNQNGDVLYQSDSVPIELSTSYLQARDTIAQRNAAMTGEKTSEQYRTFDIPGRFDNPGQRICSYIKMLILVRCT
jgi:hypothetical protein